ncbi:MAG: acyltransferase domain-containing protein [Deltaproteobacteria bacterium]|nr:acyltransferase domain-containing protein [Deltaproteobacteria bacterium]
MRPAPPADPNDSGFSALQRRIAQLAPTTKQQLLRQFDALLLTRAHSTPPPTRTLQLLCLAAASDDDLNAQAKRRRQTLSKLADQRVLDICYTNNASCNFGPHRAAVWGKDHAELDAKLQEIEQGQGSTRRQVLTETKTALLFSGQGAQRNGMGRALYEQHPVFRRALERHAKILADELAHPLLDLMFGQLGDEELINQTAYTQPALVSFELAISELWSSWGIRPDAVLGHSVGEIAAACVAGVLCEEQALRLIAARGRMMQALPAGGAMAAVIADESTVIAALQAVNDSRLAVAGYNGPRSLVISGPRSAVDAASAEIKKSRARVVALRVSHAFHSPLMEPMLEAFGEYVATLNLSPPKLTLISNLTGTAAGDEVARAEYWVEHVRKPVRFAQGISALLEHGISDLLEVGPTQTLVGMGKKCVSDRSDLGWIPSLRKGKDESDELFAAIGELFVRGHALDLEVFDQPYSPQLLAWSTEVADADWQRAAEQRLLKLARSLPPAKIEPLLEALEQDSLR